jgi:hypothetical protein
MKRSGSSEEDVHKPNLWYFELLLFTKDQEEPTDSICNMPKNEDWLPHVLLRLYTSSLLYIVSIYVD